MATNPTPNMDLPVPTVGVESGPQWAADVNSCFTLIDGHNHASGSGVQINPNGININSDLPINNNNLTQLKSSRYTSQGSPLSGGTDLNCTYVSDVDLYYNDGNGNQVRITQSGNVAGTPGSISNLTSPASASYNSVSETFVWQSAANTPANLDAGSVIFRDVIANSNGITVSPPSSLPSNYTLTLPALPAMKNFMTLDASGNMSAPWNVDNSTITINSNTIEVPAGGITTTQIADSNVTQPKLYTRTTGTTATAGNIAISNSSGSFSTTSTSPVLVTNCSITLTTTGRPVIIKIIPTNSSTSAQSTIDANDSGGGNLYFYRNSSQISNMYFSLLSTGASRNLYVSPFDYLDVGLLAGTYNYQLYATSVGSSGGSMLVTNMVICAYEIN
jgi:hypothetical protein